MLWSEKDQHEGIYLLGKFNYLYEKKQANRAECLLYSPSNTEKSNSFNATFLDTSSATSLEFKLAMSIVLSRKRTNVAQRRTARRDSIGEMRALSVAPGYSLPTNPGT